MALAGAAPIIGAWQRVLALAEGRDDDLDGEVEWVTKRALMRRYADSRGLHWDDRRLAQVDLAFHDITTDDDGRPRGLFRLLEARGAAVRLTTPQQVEQALVTPPHDRRAVLPGRLIRARPRPSSAGTASTGRSSPRTTCPNPTAPATIGRCGSPTPWPWPTNAWTTRCAPSSSWTAPAH
ncbi:MAG: proteasome accessory factor PafA2 family protein [Micropruina glycogenica]